MNNFGFIVLFLQSVHTVILSSLITFMNDPSKKPAAPVIGEKPCCRIHVPKPIEFVCTARECRHRVLCMECVTEHERVALSHKTLVIKLNDWYKEFNSLKGLFDPADNHSILFLLEQISQSLAKQREQLNESQTKMGETFQKALKEFVEFFNALSDEMKDTLWKKQKFQEDALEKVKKNLEQMSYKNCKKQIYDLMKSELTQNFQRGTVDEFYSKVYNGEYSNQVFDRYGGIKTLHSDLRNLRDDIEEGFRRFDAKKFEEVWHDQLEDLKLKVKDNFFKGIFQRVELDLLNPKNPKVRVVEDNLAMETVEKFPKVVCTSSLTVSGASLCASISKDILLTASSNKIFQVWDASHNYRVLSEVDQSNEDDEAQIKSICTIDFIQKGTKEIHHFVLIGGDDDFSHLELWNYGTNKFMTLIENAHENGISCIKEIKSEYSVPEDSCTYYIATAASDNMIKIWTLIISRASNSEFSTSLKLYKESEVHTEFITCLVSLPKCGILEGSVIISGSHDKSVNFWRWEEDSTEDKEKMDEEIKTSGKTCGKACSENCECKEKYHFKMKCAHSDFVKAIVLLYDRSDASDLEFFATGGGDSMIKIWSLKEKKLLKAFSNNKRPVSKMAYLGLGKLATSANEKQLKEYYVYIWDWPKAQMLAVLKDHKAMIQNVTKLYDDSLLTSDNKLIKIWKLEYGESSSLKQSKEHQNGIITEMKY